MKIIKMNNCNSAVLAILAVIILASADNEINVFADSSEERVSSLPAQLITNDSSRVSEIVSLVQQGKSNDANQFFKNFTLDVSLTKVPIIVTDLFAGNISNVKTILPFLRNMPFCKQVVAGHDTLLKAMIQNGYQRTAEILLLPGIDGESCDFYFSQLRNDLKQYITNIVSDWAPQIRSGSFKNITDFFVSYPALSPRTALTLNLQELVIATYSQNVLNTKTILSFLRNLPYCAQVVEGHKGLFQAMIQSGHQRKSEMLLLGATNATNCISYFSQFKPDLKSYHSIVIANWSSQIHAGNFDGIKKVFNTYSDASSRHALDVSLPELMSVTYADSVVNADVLFKFVQALPYYSNVAAALPALYAEMERNGDDKSYQDIFKFANVLKWALGSELLTHPPFIATFTGLKNKVPLVIRKIVWGEVCTIKNVLYDEYMYQAGIVFARPSGERQVFTWGPKGPSFSEGKWKFKTASDGKQMLIINEHGTTTGLAEEHMHLVMDTGEKFDEMRRHIVTTGHVSSHNSSAWNLEAVKISNYVNDTKGIFYLRSGLGNYFLYAGNESSKHDKDRRRVFVLVGTRAVPSAAQWEIDCS